MNTLPITDWNMTLELDDEMLAFVEEQASALDMSAEQYIAQVFADPFKELSTAGDDIEDLFENRQEAAYQAYLAEQPYKSHRNTDSLDRLFAA